MQPDRDWRELLADWFGETREDPTRIKDRMAWWFQADAERDSLLESRYGTYCEAAASGDLNDWQDEPRPRLAMMLALDQLPRNLYRGDARAFLNDDRAAMLCLAGVASGMDRELLPIERVFFYMPLQHAEDLAAQEVSAGLFQALADEQSANSVFEGCADFARLHRDIVAQFGRFPHRNEILGRTSTDAEKAYLESGAERFGQ